MDSIMNTYINPTFVNSGIVKSLHKKGFSQIEKISFNKLHVKINTLLNCHLPSDIALKIIMTWQKTIYIVAMLKNISTSEDSYVCLSGIKNNINSLTLNLKNLEKHSSALGINCLLQGREPDFHKILSYLKELEKFIDHCINNKEFRRGGTYSPDYIKKYGVFSLFHIGITLGLPHKTKNSSLFKFVQILTDLDSKQISTYYAQYKPGSINEMLRGNKMCSFIYKPDKLFVK